MNKIKAFIFVVSTCYGTSLLADVNDSKQLADANKFIQSTVKLDESIKKKVGYGLSERSMSEIKESTERKDAEFNGFNIAQKHYILKELRQIESGNSLEAAIAAKAMDLAEIDGFFILDLTDEQLEFYNKQAEKEVTEAPDVQSQFRIRSDTTCFTASFPDFQPKKNSGTRSIYRPSNVTPVKNGAGDCDWQVWFSASKSYVWSTTFAGRTLLHAFGSGVASRKASGGDRLLLGKTRTTIILGGPTTIANSIVIW